MKIRTAAVAVLVLAAALTGEAGQAQAAPQRERLEVTTYYPSPVGVYENLWFHPSDESQTCSGNLHAGAVDHRGMVYYDQGDNSLKVCLADGDGNMSWQILIDAMRLGHNTIFEKDTNDPGIARTMTDIREVNLLADVNVSGNFSTYASGDAYIGQTSRYKGWGCDPGQIEYIDGKGMPACRSARLFVDGGDGAKGYIGINSVAPEVLLDIHHPDPTIPVNETWMHFNGNDPIKIFRFIDLKNNTPHEIKECEGATASSCKAISPAEYRCVAAGFGAEYDERDDTKPDIYQVWTFTDINMKYWYVQARFPEKTGPGVNDAEPDVDVICFHKALARHCSTDMPEPGDSHDKAAEDNLGGSVVH